MIIIDLVDEVDIQTENRSLNNGDRRNGMGSDKLKSHTVGPTSPHGGDESQAKPQKQQPQSLLQSILARLGL